MLVTEGTLLKKSGGKVPMSQVSKETSPNKRKPTRPQEYWLYDPIAKMFIATAVDRIASQKTSVIYKLTTKVYKDKDDKKGKPGDEVLLPGGAQVWIRRHGMETLSHVKAMHTLRNWGTAQVCRVKFTKGKDPMKYWQDIYNIETLERPKNEEEELPVFAITGSAMSRLLVIDNFLVG